MDKRDALEREYRLKKKMYEEQEDDIYLRRNRGIATLEDVQDRSLHILKDYVPDEEMLMNGLRKIDNMKEEVVETTKVELTTLSRKIEELDKNYHHQLRKLEENSKQGEDS